MDGMVCDQLMLPVSTTVAPEAARYTVISEKWAYRDDAGECATRCAFGGENGPIASTSYPRNGGPSGLSRQSPFLSPVPVKIQDEASSTQKGGRAWVVNRTPSSRSSERLTGDSRNSVVAYCVVR